MDLEVKNNELIALITSYLSKEGAIQPLQEFAWEVIDYFTSSNKEELPLEIEGEKEFWYAIWLIQHVADQEHEADGVTEHALEESLTYLKKTGVMPSFFRGERP